MCASTQPAMEEALRELETEILEFEKICKELGQTKAGTMKPELKPKPILVTRKEKPKTLPKPKLGFKSSVKFSTEETEDGTEV